MKTFHIVTSKSGTVYYNYFDDVKDTGGQVIEGRKYFSYTTSSYTFNFPNIKYTVSVLYNLFYEYEPKTNSTASEQINTDDTVYDINCLKDDNTNEKYNNYSYTQLEEYLNDLKEKDNNAAGINNESSENEFVNETGHLADDGDNVSGLSSLFDSENIVEEEMFEVHFENDEYHQAEPVDTESIMKEFQAVDDTTTLMGSSVSEAEDINDVTLIETNGRTSKNTLEAAVGIVAAVNDLGQYIKRGSKCPVCGKQVDFMPANGYCSITCAGKDLLKKLSASLSGEYETETPNIIEKIKNILSYFNLALNVISKIPDILASTAKLPVEYRNYTTAKINLIFLDIKKIINKLLIKKNELLIKLLRRMKFGTIDKQLAGLFATLNSILTALNAAKQSLETALASAYDAIKKASALFYIGPQEYGFFWTLKSNMAICPFYKTDATVYPSGQLGRPFWGGMTMNIAFDMSKCQFSTSIGAKSALQNVDFEKINKIIRKVFLPIQTVEYLMDPDLFDVRLALSDQNAPKIEKLVRLLEKTIVIGGDFVPTYENLNLTNIWFDIAILTCWGPWTRSIFGDFIFHGAL